jgi:tetratricopeptide (TPR) repeat protein
MKAVVAPEEYFVLSRIDGTQTLREVLLATGLPVDRAVSIVARLRSLGALLLPGETTAPAGPPQRPTPVRLNPPQAQAQAQAQPQAQPPPIAPAVPRTLTPMGQMPSGSRPTVVVTHDLTLPSPTEDELAALAEEVELDEQERRRILAMARLAGGDPYALLGMPQGADARALKLAYFQLSKEIHPDRYYGKRLGSFATRLPAVFEAASRAYARLTTSDKGRGGSPSAAQTSDQPQTPQEYAAELFDRACQLEVSGDAMEAMKLFAAAVRVDPQARYLRRAASCALAANQPKTAVEYAKKAQVLAPNDPSAARLLAAAFRAAGKLSDAEEVLVIAMAIKTENDVLAAELRNDLAEVRRLIAR